MSCGLFSWPDVAMAMVLSWAAVNVLMAVLAVVVVATDDDEAP